MDKAVMERNPDDSTPADRDVATIERAFVAMRRAQTRRTLARLSARSGRRHAALPDAVFGLLDAVDATITRGTSPVVTELAVALGIDQPRASRLAAQAIEAGLLRRDADQADGRRSLLTLTPAGDSALRQIRAFRQDVIAEAIATWPTRDRADLARLLTRFVDDIAAVSTPPEK